MWQAEFLEARGEVGFKYAITLASFKDVELLEHTMERISGLGFDAVEMYGEPENVDIRRLSEIFDSYGMPVCGITGMWGSKARGGSMRNLLGPDASLQKQAGDYVKKCVRMCHLLGGKHMNVCLFAEDDFSFFDRTHRAVPAKSKSDTLKIAAPILSELARFAAEHQVTLLVEPLNRYSTPYCNTANDALNIVQKVNSEYLGIMLDTFHMNIEEDSFEHTILNAKGALRHMHFADNNRKMPGYGHIDFKAIVGALVHTEYNGYVTFEPTIYDHRNYELSLKNGLQFIKSLEGGV